MSLKLRAVQPKEYVGDEVITISTADSRYAKKADLPNEYISLSSNQTISGGIKTVSQNSTWNFKGSSLRLETIDGSSNIGIKNNGGILVDLGNNPYVNVATDNTYNSGKRNIFRTLPEVYSSSTLPTKDVELTTKKYVDNKVAGVVTVSGNNTFTGTNTFNNNVNIGSAYRLGFGTNYIQDSGGGDSFKITFANGQVRYLGSNANNGGDYVTKSYVDEKFQTKLRYVRVPLLNVMSNSDTACYNSGGDNFEYKGVRSLGSYTNNNMVFNIVLERGYYSEDWRRGISFDWGYNIGNNYTCWLRLRRPKDANCSDYANYFKDFYLRIFWFE